VTNGFVSPSGLDVSHSFRWLTPPAVDVSASGLSPGFPHGTKIAQINSLCKIRFLTAQANAKTAGMMEFVQSLQKLPAMIAAGPLAR